MPGAARGLAAESLELARVEEGKEMVVGLTADTGETGDIARFDFAFNGCAGRARQSTEPP